MPPGPQLHAPFRHRSDSGPHGPHIAPPLPHAVTVVAVTHVLFWQHPVHVVESHTHWPAEHRWPSAHGRLFPHAQAPASQVSPRCCVQFAQMMPERPQAIAPCMFGGRHAPFWQQPEGHSAALHPEHPVAVQVWPAGHDWHVAPPMPHEPAWLPCSQLPASGEQQPVHAAGLHWQRPATHCMPAAH